MTLMTFLEVLAWATAPLLLISMLLILVLRQSKEILRQDEQIMSQAKTIRQQRYVIEYLERDLMFSGRPSPPIRVNAGEQA